MKKIDSIEIFIENNSDEYNDLVENGKEYRKDVYVKYQNKYFKMNVYSSRCLIQSINNRYELEKVYFIDNNLLIVKRVNKKDIINTVIKYAEKNYFDQLKECQVMNNEIMYPLDEVTIQSYKETNWPISIQVDKLVKIY